ncbi:MAG: MFS transporter, partial [Candidatus Bathyarchaeia archaeon]
MPFRQTGNRTWLVLLSTLFQGASFAVLWMFLPLYVSEIATISEIALIMALPYIATVLTANLWGYVSDFIGRRKPLI